MNASGELIQDKIIVKKPRDVGRFYTKSRLGKTITGNKLQLDLIEGVFLLDEKKLTIFQDKKEVSFEKLVKLATKHISRFEIRYLVFRSLRKRGYFVKMCEREKDSFDFFIDKKNGKGKSSLVCVYSERDFLDVDKTKDLIGKASKKKSMLWFAIVDEEGDLTYYDVSMLDIKGRIRSHRFSKKTGMLLDNRVVVFDKKLSCSLFEKEFFGKPFGDGLQISMVETLYLLEQNIIELKHVGSGKKISKNDFKKIIRKNQSDIDLRIAVFEDLKSRGLIVKTGFKFGSHFRAYTRMPDETHAEYLVHVVEKGFKSIWAEISRAVRLAHSVNKEIFFARVDKDKIDYIKFGRLRP